MDMTQGYSHTCCEIVPYCLGVERKHKTHCKGETNCVKCLYVTIMVCFKILCTINFCIYFCKENLLVKFH